MNPAEGDGKDGVNLAEGDREEAVNPAGLAPDIVCGRIKLALSA